MAKKTWLRGDRLHDLRKERNWSQEELADKLGLSNQQHVSKWEAGANDPSADNLVLLARFFDVSIDYLLDQTTEPKGKLREYTEDEMKELLFAYITPDRAPELLEYIARFFKGKN